MHFIVLAILLSSVLLSFLCELFVARAHLDVAFWEPQLFLLPSLVWLPESTHST